jgi:predicted NBD/HSP70 family sugar kinase/predicted transcriptional regulator
VNRPPTSIHSSMKTIGDQQLVKRINRSVLLRLLRKHSGLSRARLAQESGLTKSTVSLLVRELIEEGWLSEAESTSAPGLGRPSTPLHIDGTRRAVVGVEVAVEVLRAVAVSLTGEVLVSLEEPLTDTQPPAVCRQAARLVARLVKDLVLRQVQLSGVGMGLPGAFDETTGMVSFAPNLGWRRVDFMPLMTRALEKAGVPSVQLHVQNEADTAALSEYEFFGENVKDSLIFVTCDVGVGAGILLNDRLFTGVHGMAGEIGHSILQIDGPKCSCGRNGCVETFIGARALARLSDPAKGGKYLGVVLQNLWTTFDPGALVIGGPSCEKHPEIIAVAKDALQAYAASAGMATPTVRAARYGLLASAVGAAALVLYHELRPMHTPAAPVATSAADLSETSAPAHILA